MGFEKTVLFCGWVGFSRSGQSSALSSPAHSKYRAPNQRRVTATHLERHVYVSMAVCHGAAASFLLRSFRMCATRMLRLTVFVICCFLWSYRASRKRSSLWLGWVLGVLTVLRLLQLRRVEVLGATQSKNGSQPRTSNDTSTSPWLLPGRGRQLLVQKLYHLHMTRSSFAHGF